MAPDCPASYRRILLTRMKFIGDIVLTTPAIRSVRLSCPDAHVAYLGEKNAVALLEHNPFLDEVIPYDFSRPTVFEQTRVAALLRRRRFDLAVDFFGNPRSALLTWLSGAHVRVGPDRAGRGALYSIRVRADSAPKTAIAFHNSYIAAAGIPPIASAPEIFLTHEERNAADQFLQQVDGSSMPIDSSGPIVGLHPGASWPAKRWLPERFAQLADKLRSELGAQVIVTSGPRDTAVSTAVTTQCRIPIRVVTNRPLRQLAAIISRCAVFVSNDAGPMHIAAALGVPTIGLFGPGEENIWFPYDARLGHLALRRDVFCHPCHLDVCNRSGADYMECMKRLNTEDVFSAVKQCLAR